MSNLIFIFRLLKYETIVILKTSIYKNNYKVPKLIFEVTLPILIYLVAIVAAE